jgi:predicted transcriptional regulator
MTTPKQSVEYLIGQGLTQNEIKAATGISQPTISRILSGDHLDPRYSTGVKLKLLVEEVAAR